MFTRAVCVVLAFAVPAIADSKPATKAFDENPSKWKLNQEGHFTHPRVNRQFGVVEVISDTELLMREILSTGPSLAFILSGKPTKGIVDKAILDLEGNYKVTGTRKHGGRTVFVIEPIKR